MAYVERTDAELITALENAISKKAVNADEVVLRAGNSSYTYNQVLEECRKKTEFGLKFLNDIRKCGKECGRDPLDWIGHYSKTK